MMSKEKTVLALFFSFILLGYAALTTGCTTGEGPGTTTPVPTPPTFQPGILDKLIINAPPGKGGASPFLFEFDTENASGFEAVRADQPGAPTLVL